MKQIATLCLLSLAVSCQGPQAGGDGSELTSEVSSNIPNNAHGRLLYAPGVCNSRHIDHEAVDPRANRNTGVGGDPNFGVEIFNYEATFKFKLIAREGQSEFIVQRWETNPKWSFKPFFLDSSGNGMGTDDWNGAERNIDEGGRITVSKQGMLLNIDYYTNAWSRHRRQWTKNCRFAADLEQAPSSNFTVISTSETNTVIAPTVENAQDNYGETVSVSGVQIAVTKGGVETRAINEKCDALVLDNQSDWSTPSRRLAEAIINLGVASVHGTLADFSHFATKYAESDSEHASGIYEMVRRKCTDAFSGSPGRYFNSCVSSRSIYRLRSDRFRITYSMVDPQVQGGLFGPNPERTAFLCVRGRENLR